MNKNNKILNATQIMELLPHRYPFLYIDKVVDYELGKSITAIKNVSINEPYFQGHFPGKPIMPGVIIIEAMAQAGGILGHLTVGDVRPKPIYYLVSVEQARFRFPVVAGDQLTIKVEVDRIIRGMWRYSCNACVNDEISVNAKIMCAPNI
jgi:3-hydroxyacyl-[acyl-carrier-protein] dehydratase|tara:strand:- start:46301 stop:46750 length:450 start_codon:yes stop_codon:yes gene_type:complete